MFDTFQIKIADIVGPITDFEMYLFIEVID